MKFKKLSSVLLSFCLVLAICAAPLIACTNPADKYKPVYQSTNEQGKEIYAWPEGSETGMIDVYGGQVAYRLYGKDKPGIPLIYVHGGPGGNYSAFYKQLPLAEDRPVVLYDQLGSPLSEVSQDFQTEEKVKSLYTIDRYCDELNSVIQYFGFKQFALYGSSWGCMLSLEYVGKYQPEGLKGIVFGGPFLDVDTWVNDANRLIASLDGGQEMLVEIRKCEATGVYTEKFDEINETYSLNFNNRHPQDCKDRPYMGYTDSQYLRIAGVDVYEYMWGKSEFSCTGTLAHHDSTPLLANVKVPVIYMPGQYDAGTPQAAFYYASLTPNAQVAVIPDSAHAASMERPVEFNTILTEFLNRL